MLFNVFIFMTRFGRWVEAQLTDTEGKHEIHNEEGKMLGQRRLRKIFRENAGLSSATTKMAYFNKLGLELKSYLFLNQDDLLYPLFF